MKRLYIPRAAEAKITEAAEQFPVVGLTGPRQTGKSTLLQTLFPNHTCISFDDPMVRQRALDDPDLFLESVPRPCILDEIQYAPRLLPYIKMIVDQDRSRHGQFILTGSQVFPLMTGITESLAGRIALFELLGFSWEEIGTEQAAPPVSQLFSALHRGFYPDPCVHDVDPRLFYTSYLQTYLERDIRQATSVHDLGLFQQFLELLAARNGALLNLSKLARDCGISHTTARKWISLLESTRVVVLLRPYFKNIDKRVMKSPKLYFTDTGLFAALLRYPNGETLQHGPMAGAFFESFVVMEFLKHKLNHSRLWELYFYRDSNGNEIDLIVEEADTLHLMEIKMRKTVKAMDCKPLASFPPTPGRQQKYLLSCSPESFPMTREVTALPWWKAVQSLSAGEAGGAVL